jgi:hypothetical protein
MYPIDSQVNQDRIDTLRHEAEVAHELKHLSWQHRLALNRSCAAQTLAAQTLAAQTLAAQTLAAQILAASKTKL